MDTFSLIIAESRGVADRVNAGSGQSDDPPLVALDEGAWFLRLRELPPQRHVGIVVESLARPGRILSALRLVADAREMTWLLPRTLLSPDRLDAVAREFDKAGLAVAEVEPATIGGEPATAVRLGRDDPALTGWAAALSSVAGLSRLPAASTGLATRVGFVGHAATRWFGGWARAVVVRPEWRGWLAEICGGDLDLLLVAPALERFTREDVVALASEARAMGARIVGVRDPAQASPPAWEGIVDLELVSDPASAPGQALVAARPVDIRRVNPADFPAAARTACAALGPVDGWAPSPEVVADADTDLLREYPAVVDTAAHHPDTATRAARVIELSAAGIPVILADDGGRSLRQLLGEALSAALSKVTPAAVLDGEGRERVSVEVRRAALRDHSMATRWRQLRAALGAPERRPRRVSVVLATHREDFLDHAVEQLNRQTYEPRETVVVLHGDKFSDGTEQRLHSAIDGDVRVVSVDGAWQLGDALNAGLDAASGELVAKMDDDDWYGPHHLTDLVLALEYSGAHLVGRGAEFVYLAALDVTIRRFAHEAEQPSRKLAGGTLLMARSDIDSAGGWRRVPRSVDQRLIDDVLATGGQVYRTHGFGYILNRHGRNHAWDTELDYFLQQSSWQRRGLALVDAGIVDGG